MHLRRWALVLGLVAGLGVAAPPVAARGDDWITNVSDNGAIITLEDGTVWQVGEFELIDTADWLAADDVMYFDDSSDCPGTMFNPGPMGDTFTTIVNTDKGEAACVRQLH